MNFEKDRIIKMMQSNQIASPLSFKLDSPRVYSKTPNTQSTLNVELSSRDMPTSFRQYRMPTTNRKQQKNLFSKENKFIEPLLKNQQSTDSLIQNIVIKSPASTFSEEFDKINKKFNSVKNADNEKYSVQRQSSNSVLQIENSGKQKFDFSSNVTMFPIQDKIKQIDEISLLDLKNQNIQLQVKITLLHQQENISLKSQILQQQENQRHFDKIIQKLKQNQQFLEQFNAQLKEKNEKQSTIIDKLNGQLKNEANQYIKLQQEITEKENELVKYNQIENEIKKIEDYYLQMLSKLNKELKEQHNQLKLLNHHINCLSQVSVLLSEREEIPIEILFKYKQPPLIQQITQESDIQEAIITNSLIIKDMFGLIGKAFEKISYNFVQEFTKIINKQIQ